MTFIGNQAIYNAGSIFYNPLSNINGFFYFKMFILDLLLELGIHLPIKTIITNRS